MTNIGRECSMRGKEERCLQGFVGKPEERSALGRPTRRRKITLKWTFERLDRWAWTGSIWLRQGDVAGCCECGDEPSGFIKCGEFHY
jgi:hypothetical protein